MPNPLQHFSEHSLARMSAVYSGLVFGIYWIPLRVLDAAGFSGIWSAVIFHSLSALIVAPVMVLRRDRFFPGRLRFHFIIFGTGFGYTLYTAAFVYTSVVSVLVLFYMMPIWGFLLARLFIGDRITPVRWISMLVGLVGLLVILGQSSDIPLPSNIGDWMALAAGITWAGFSLMLLTDKKAHPVDYAAGFVTWAAVCSAGFAIFASYSGMEPYPQWHRLAAELAWLFPFALIVIVPAAIATIYGPTKLNPGIVGLLFMTEISVAAITAALWAGEPFGPAQITGVLLITVAGALETVWLWLSARTKIA